jgi:hypothetical protein
MNSLDLVFAAQHRRHDIDHNRGPRPTCITIGRVDVLMRTKPAHHRAGARHIHIDRRRRVRDMFDLKRHDSVSAHTAADTNRTAVTVHELRIEKIKQGPKLIEDRLDLGRDR